MLALTASGKLRSGRESAWNDRDAENAGRATMNALLEMLQGGDIRSDGRGDEVAEIVLEDPARFDELYAGLDEPDEVVRGRTAHALEIIARSEPELLSQHTGELIALSQQEDLPMVVWHLAMIFGHLGALGEQIDRLVQACLDLLYDQGVFVRSWAISSLAVLGCAYPEKKLFIIRNLRGLLPDSSKAVRSRARKAIQVLGAEDHPMPEGWNKSQRYEKHPAPETFV
jgi:hypothetical protein